MLYQYIMSLDHAMDGADVVAPAPAAGPPSDDAYASIDSAQQSTQAAVEATIPLVVESAPRRFTSAEIDAGAFGMRYHPVNGTWMEGAAFDPVTGLFSVVHTQYGFGVAMKHTVSLARIGDAEDHTEADFPLSHWRFDPWTGTRL